MVVDAARSSIPRRGWVGQTAAPDRAGGGVGREGDLERWLAWRGSVRSGWGGELAGSGMRMRLRVGWFR